MKVLIVKVSSLGDVIHTLPALTEAQKNIPGIKFDWLVEEAFAEVPAWHQAVERVIPVALRRWRKNIWQTLQTGEWRRFRQELRQTNYDYVLDAQGLIKSALLTWQAKGVRCGLNYQSAWEPLASLFYQKHLVVSPKQHAITRVRQLFAAALNYSYDASAIVDYGINLQHLLSGNAKQNYVILLHGTTWITKHWPEIYWRQLAEELNKQGTLIKLPWGNLSEQQRAQRIAEGLNNVEVLPKLNLAGIARLLAGAKAAVAVDTGLGHLAAALRVPTISLYGPTNSQLTGAMGAEQLHLAGKLPCAPCLQEKCTYQGPRQFEPPCLEKITPEAVLIKLRELI